MKAMNENFLNWLIAYPFIKILKENIQSWNIESFTPQITNKTKIDWSYCFLLNSVENVLASVKCLQEKR
jgi:hypothetical protein